MESVIDSLIIRMNKQNVSTFELPRLIVDTMFVLDNGNPDDLETVNQKLAQMGWEAEVLDAYSYELIRLALQFVKNQTP